MKALGIGIVVLVGVLLLVFVLNIFGFSQYAFFAPKINAVQTKVFKQSQAYNDGMANDLGDLKLQYISATDPEKKDAIRAIILQRFASYDKTQLPPDLQNFYNSL